LLECEECWTEVEAARRGQTAVELIREFAPPHLRASVRRTSAGGSPGRRRTRRIALVAAACIILTAGIATTLVVISAQPSDSAAVAAAVSGYTEGRLPGNAMPSDPGPDLSSMEMKQVGAGTGRIGDMHVTAYAYRDPTGRRLMIYTSSTAFTMPDRAELLDGPDGAWMTHREGVALLFSRRPHELLVLGEDDELVHHVAESLDLM
jgi:hypothetical protein